MNNKLWEDFDWQFRWQITEQLTRKLKDQLDGQFMWQLREELWWHFGEKLKENLEDKKPLAFP